MKQPSKLDELIKHRKINYEFVSNLEFRDKAPYKDPRMPGSIIKSPGVDPRLHLVNPHDEIVMAERLATIRHRTSGRIFVVYRDTIDALYLESQDLQKYPQWLMEDPKKQNERSIRINEMLRPPKDKYDRGWLGDINESTYDSLAYFIYMSIPKEEN
jgi:hypothetical protein